MKPVGYILYRGPSMLDGKPIIVVANKVDAGSKNAKTGAMVQTWILCDDGMTPTEAAQGGADASICGSCPHMRDLETGVRTCYVILFHAPRAVYEAYNRGRYLDVSGTDYSEVFRGLNVRLGSYGDPAAAPTEVWETMTRRASSWTGYTHQWRSSYAEDLRPYCMASVDSFDEATTAQAAGWRTFRVGPAADVQTADNEVLCPASAEAGHRTTCADCNLCMGATSKARKSIMIPAHGPTRRHVVASVDVSLPVV